MVAFYDNDNAANNASVRFTLHYCTGQMKLDVVKKQCVTAEQCTESGRLVQGPMCLVACTDQYYTSSTNDGYCYFDCPLWRGMVSPTDDSLVCTVCAANQLATESGCVTETSCASGFKFGKGCYTECPLGTLV